MNELQNINYKLANLNKLEKRDKLIVCREYIE